MKKNLLFTIICLFILSANSVFALKYSDAILIEAGKSNVSQQHISEAKLLRTYLSRYKQDINKMYIKNTNEVSGFMQNTNLILDDMLYALNLILTKAVDPTTVESHMLEIVKDIKIINVRMKEYLKEEQKIFQQKLEQKKQNYITSWNRLSLILDTLESRLTSVLIKRKELSNNEKVIVKSLVRIRKENEKIKNFQNITFISEAEMKLYFKNIIIVLKKEILILKNASR